MRRSRTRSASAVYTADGILVLMKITSFILPPYTPFRVYARKRCCSRNYYPFRATHEKGNFLPRLRLWAITKSKIPMHSIALRVRLACTTLTATSQNDASIIRGTPVAVDDAWWQSQQILHKNVLVLGHPHPSTTSALSSSNETKWSEGSSAST